MRILKGYNGRPVIVRESELHNYVNTTYGWLRRDKKYMVEFEHPTQVGTCRMKKTGQQIYDDMVEEYEQSLIKNSPAERAKREKEIIACIGSLENPDLDKMDFVGKAEMIKSGEYEEIKKQVKQKSKEEMNGDIYL